MFCILYLFIFVIIRLASTRKPNALYPNSIELKIHIMTSVNDLSEPFLEDSKPKEQTL